jgi:hypothetical protein
MDNINSTCAPRMADGRLFSDYRSGDIRDNIAVAGFMNANDHRHFLQNNAEEIMQVRADRVSDKECSQCDLRPSVGGGDAVDEDSNKELFTTSNGSSLSSDKPTIDTSSTRASSDPDTLDMLFSFMDNSIVKGIIFGSILYVVLSLYRKRM